MKNDSILAAADIGTSSCKVALFSLDGTLIANDSVSYRTNYGRGGVAEQDPDSWWNAFCTASKRLNSANTDLSRNIVCLCITGQMSALLGVDDSGQPVFPAMTWEDQRAGATLQNTAIVLNPKEYYGLTGNPLSPVYPFSKLLWRRSNDPDSLSRTRSFVQPKDYLIYKLTGELLTDFSDASCTGMFNITTRQWEPSLVEMSGIRLDQLPEIVPSITVAGKVTPDAARQCGLPTGLPVATGGGDGPMSAVAAGAVSEESSYTAFGTSAWISVTRSAPDLENGERLLNFCHIVPELYAVTGSIQNAGNVLSWLMRACFDNHDDVPSAGALIDRLEDELLQTPVGSDGLTFLPFLLGDRTPYWSPELSGSLIGLRPHHSRIEILHAALEGIALHFRLVRELLLSQNSASATLRALGGGISGNVFPQILSDVLFTPIEVRAVKESATSMGAAIVGGVATGIWNDISEATDNFMDPRVEQWTPRYGSDDYRSLLHHFTHLVEVMKTHAYGA